MKTENLKKRRIFIGKHSISLLTVLFLIAMISVTAVSATAYVVITWTTNATIVANPKVCFIKWSDGSKANTFSYSVNTFPNVVTVDTNITYGLWNWDSQAHNVYFRLVSENTNTTDISYVYYKVYNGGTLYSKNETDLDSPDTNWSSVVSASASTKYTIEMQIKSPSGAGVGHTPTFNFEVKVENP